MIHFTTGPTKTALGSGVSRRVSPPRCPCPKPQNLGMCYTAKGTLQMIKWRLFRWGECPGYPGGTHVITRILISKREEESTSQSAMILATAGFEEGRTLNQGCKWLPEAGKSKETDSPQGSPGGMQPCWHLDFSPVRSGLDF